jgi:phosphatidylglycerol:prolipoprotein diacylglycerol transferase
MIPPAVINIDINPTIELGPLTLSWHGLSIASGILLGSVLATAYARRRELDPERVLVAVWLIAGVGIIGAKLFYLLVNAPGDLLRPAEWFSGQGFAFYGAMIFGTAAVALYLWRNQLDLRYLDALASGFPLGMAVGRIGDVINGEHYGPPSDAPWAFRYLHPGADVPSDSVAYHSGGFYEVILALVMLPMVLALARRLRRPGALLWSVIALYGAGRFLMFFYRSDSDPFALGLNEAQWTSLALIAVAGLGAWLSERRSAGRRLAHGSYVPP